jgi:hypothetical protein
VLLGLLQEALLVLALERQVQPEQVAQAQTRLWLDPAWVAWVEWAVWEALEWAAWEAFQACTLAVEWVAWVECLQ